MNSSMPWMTTALLLVVGVGPVDGQSISDRVGGVVDGTVRMSFTARDGVCSVGDGMRVISGSPQSEDWERDCPRGPVRVVLRIAHGEVVGVSTYIGGRWRARNGAVDLGMVPAPEAAAFLIQLAATSDGPAGEDAILPAAVADSVSVVAALGRIARDDSRPAGLREKAVFWIGQSPEEEAADLLRALLAGPEKTDLGEQVIFALSQHRSPRARVWLRELAEDDAAPSTLRERAIFWLGQARGDGRSGFLQDLYRRLDDDVLKERVIFAVSQGPDLENRQWLIALALDDNEPLELRKRAIFWVGQQPRSIPGLYELYDELSVRDLREQLIFVYSLRREDAAVDRLITIARAETDRGLRGKALFWLGQARNPKAAAFLDEIIR